MKKKGKGYLIDYALPICLNIMPIICFAVFLLVCILPGTETGAFTFSNLVLFISLSYLLGLTVAIVAYLSKFRNSSFSRYCRSIRFIWQRSIIILLGILVCFGSMKLSLLDVFNDDFFLNLVRLFLMLGVPILIALFFSIWVSSIEEPE